MRNRHKTWTGKEILCMKKMFDQGESDRDIAEVLGRTDVAVKRKRNDLGMTNKKPGRPNTRQQVKSVKPVQTHIEFEQPSKGAKYTHYMKPQTEVSLLWGLIKYTKA